LFEKGAWRPSVRLAWCDRMQGQRPLQLTGASGGVELSPTLSITALFFEGAYKFMVAGSKGPLLVI
jgi:hypothetical protein